MIEVQNVIYEYPNKRALKDVSFVIKRGSITALVGPNGAGKTTLMRCISALDEPFSGSIRVSGIDALENPREVHKKIGYLSDFFGIYHDLTVRQCLIFIASIHQIPSHEITKRVESTAALLNLSSYLENKAGTLSRGLRQRLGIAQAMIHNPEILILDEPASGLDPEARISLSKLFLSLQKEGATLLISSHILSELEDYCTEMLLLRDGKLINHSADTPKIQLLNVDIELCDDASSYVNKISSLPGISNLKCEGKLIECSIAGSEKDLHLLLKELIQHDIPVYSFSLQKKRLQDIYMDYAHKGEDHA